jgi:ketosteroid isomerase-like protein
VVKKGLTGDKNRDFDGGMKTSKFILIVCLIILPLAVVCNFPPAAQASDEQAVRDADAEWSKAAGAKDLDKTVSFYADDAIVLPPNEAAVTTKDGIRNLWKGFLDSLQNISWKTTRVETSKSGDMACLIGTYEMTMKDGSKDKGKYCEVWEKKAGGKWKVATDMFSSDLPAPGSSPSPAAGAADKK